MMESAAVVAEKVIVLFIMIAVGYGCARAGALKEEGTLQLTNILFYVVTPCLIVNSLQNTMGIVDLGQLLLAGGLSFVSMGLAIVLCPLLFRRAEEKKKRMMRFCTIYSNCGFMGLPLAQAILCDTGAAYASVFVVAYNILVWTHGVGMLGARSMNLKKALLNPGLIGLAAGLPLFMLGVRLPVVLETPVSALAAVNTPLAMLVIGGYIAKVRWRDLIADLDVYKVCFWRLLAVPALLFLLLWLIRPESMAATTVLVLAAAPCGANAVLFAAMFQGDTETAGKSVAMSTLLSVLTMPAFAVLGQWL